MLNSNRMTSTIVALATPIAESAVGVLRLSGDKAFYIVDQLCPNRDFSTPESHRVVLAELRNPKNGEWLDQALVTCFRAPSSFTGEDVVEISCHGNPLILREVLEACLSLGAEAAAPGEFTRRAYLNGKLDLTQAEAINDLIHAHTRLARASAGNQLEGKLTKVLEEPHSRILDLLSLLEVSIDHGDLDLEFSPPEEIDRRLLNLLRELRNLLQTSQAGKILHYGLKVVLVGSPNVGKSSVMNVLLRKDRVIVSEIAGTTRDLVEDELNIRGIPVRLTDTAGVRVSNDPVESLGIDRSRRALEESDLAVFLIDSSRPVSRDDWAFYETVKIKAHLVILNKIDLPKRADVSLEDFKDAVSVLTFSALTAEGLTEFENAVEQFYRSFGQDPKTDVMLTNVRQESLVKEACDFLEKAREAIANGLSEEFIAADVRKARQSLEAIVGQTDDDVILDRIFSSFCIGK